MNFESFQIYLTSYKKSSEKMINIFQTTHTPILGVA